MRTKPAAASDFKWPLHVFPRVLHAGRYAINDTEFPRIYDEHLNALYLHDYNGRARIGEREFEFRKGDVTLSPAGMGAAFSVNRAGYNFCIHFDMGRARAGEFLELPFHIPLGKLGDFAAQKCWHIFNLLTVPTSKASIDAISSSPKMGGLNRVPMLPDDPVVRASASVTLQELILWLALRNRSLGRSTVNRGRAEYVVEEAVQWLGTHMHQPLHVPVLAKHLGISHNYLARRFRERFGVTIPRYFLTLRIKHALHLLRATTMPVKSIGDQIGMPDPHHFNKQFRRITGQSPSSMRQQREKYEE
jgi:AraC-like DNA-binding protein